MSGTQIVAVAAAAVALLLGAGPSRARAQGRPDESSLFGGAPSSTPAPPPPAPETPTTKETPPPGAGSDAAKGAPPAAANQAPVAPPASGGSARDQFVLGDPNAATKFGADAAPENPLTIGGQLYLRAQSSVPTHTDPKNWSLAAPTLVDAFFDARPNDRVRAYILGRMSFDPTASATSSSAPSAMPSSPTSSAVPATGFTTIGAGRGPHTLLDQMWLAFDIEHKVFVTAGKQHVKWGTGHIWTPTDYLHPTKRNPLDVFDVRGGVTMLRVQVPWEAQAWNFYGFAVFEDPTLPTSKLDNVAGALRAEMVILGAELGLDVLAKSGQRPRFGADLSTGVGDFDVYADAGLRFGNDFAVVNSDSTAALVNAFPALADPNMSASAAAGLDLPRLTGFKAQVVGGVSYTQKYNDNDLFVIGGEYFYNQAGYSDRNLYPTHLAYQFLRPDLPLNSFFYLGRRYAALSLSLPAPYSWNYTTFTLSTLGNLSDGSYVSRLDYSVTFLTHLTFQAFVAVHFGQEGGELRFAVQSPLFTVPTPLMDLGVALRLKF